MCKRWVAVLVSLLVPYAGAQEAPPVAAGSVTFTFLPPPMEHAFYSLGVYEANSRRLVRRLYEATPEGAFPTALNGLIARWDRKDDAGKLVPPGRYTARGYAIGPLKVEGVAFHGNDWVDADENLRVKHVESIRVAPDGHGLLAFVTLADGAACELALSPDGNLTGRQPHPDAAPPAAPAPAPGKDGSAWTAEGDAGLIQRGADGTVLRRLAPAPGDPTPRAVAVSAGEERLYLLEQKDGWQRLRALQWVEAKEDGGQAVSTWQTVFERNIRKVEIPGGEEGARPVEIPLDENPLSPGKPSRVKLAAGFDGEGSYLQTADGLRLRRVSDRRHLSAARLVRGKGLTFYQFDGAAWDEFVIGGASAMMAFDAGEFELTATGEKAPEGKPPEPPDL